MTRTVGNRYSEEEARKIDMEDLKASYTLIDQDDFKGSQEELKYLQYAERRYFDSRPIMSDEEFDILKHKHNYKETLESVTPSGRNIVKLLAPLVSLDKAGNYEETHAFLDKIGEGEKIVEVKLDGLCGNVIYTLNTEDYEEPTYTMETISSRGPIFGMEFNKEAFYGVNTNIPKELPAELVNVKDENGNYVERIELRGELVIPITEETLERYKKVDDLTGEYVEPVWRSIASGMTTRKVPNNLPGLLRYWQEQEPVVEGQNNITMTNVGFEAGNPTVARSFYSLIPEEQIMNEETGKPYRFGRTWKLKVNAFSEKMIVTTASDEVIFEVSTDGMQEYLDCIFYSMAVDGANLDVPIHKDKPGSFKRLVESGLISHVSNIPFREDKLDEVKGYKPTYRLTSDENEIIQAVLDFYGNEEVLDHEGKPVWQRNSNLPRLRNLYKYAMDGVVIKPANSSRDSQKLDKRIGRNGKVVVPHDPSDQVAVKLRSEVVSVMIKEFEYTTTKLGNVTITAILDNSYRCESGSYVNRVNCHNPNWMELNSWIKKAQEKQIRLDLVMSMDIIPVFLKPDWAFEDEKKAAEQK